LIPLLKKSKIPEDTHFKRFFAINWISTIRTNGWTFYTLVFIRGWKCLIGRIKSFLARITKNLTGFRFEVTEITSWGTSLTIKIGPVLVVII
jgi:hypothetical protein